VSEENIKRSIDDAQAPDAATLLRIEVERLSKLDRAGYLVERKQTASRYKIPAVELDKLVDAGRRPAPEAQRESLAPPAPEPHTERVEAQALLHDLYSFIKRFVVLGRDELIAVTLWVAFTYCFEIAETSPRLRLKSPDKRCGKTRLLEVLSFLIPRSIVASSLSPSAIFRIIDAEHCGLFIDEADTFIRTRARGDNEELRGLLNSGHTRASAFVIRSVPAGERSWEPRRFSTWCPMAIAGIGKLPDTVEDRSITISMRRKLACEKVERLTRRNKTARAHAATLASKLVRFAVDNIEELREAEPQSPEALNDRAADNWEHLLAIADLAGGDWPHWSREAAVALSGNRDNVDDDSLGAMLLADLRAQFVESQIDKHSSKAICDALVAMEGRPWAEYRRGKPLSPNQLARALSPFEIAPHTIRLPDGSTAKGYELKDFQEAFERYLSNPKNDSSNRHNVTTQRGVCESDDLRSVTEDPRYASEKGSFPYGENDCDGVAVQEAEINPLAKADGSGPPESKAYKSTASDDMERFDFFDDEDPDGERF
jgi:putative DNA primase/helicase